MEQQPHLLLILVGIVDKECTLHALNPLTVCRVKSTSVTYGMTIMYIQNLVDLVVLMCNIPECCNLEREYRDCIKSRRDKISRHIMMQQVLYNGHVTLLTSLGNCTIYSTWCIMICLVIPILSLLLFIQSLYSLSKLPFTCLLSFFAAFSNCT